ncbi:50S ribosomal protein L22 [Bremerella sp. T1]|uniref:50S ribosomal protein L22 n=1 Tax=Bremerella sp. TYQ1 TaxID=3119568 RepID=UPI001CCC9A5F|nr:50S ribosomal protein L22 [Bremerella volcania]UBM35059.1 50S ribosomal protein L22 [Bremerella volcania]
MFKATHRLARISPRKVRPLADLVRGKLADEALDILRYQPQRGARLLEEVIKSAIGNSQDSEQNEGRSANQQALYVSEARVDGGPIIKRFRPRARGSAFPILKRTCHIHVTLEELQG